MPAKLMMTRPLAFLLVLRGLKPVSYDLNFMEGDKTFEEIATNRWTEAADKVKKRNVLQLTLRVVEKWGVCPPLGNFHY